MINSLLAKLIAFCKITSKDLVGCRLVRFFRNCNQSRDLLSYTDMKRIFVKKIIKFILFNSVRKRYSLLYIASYKKTWNEDGKRYIMQKCSSLTICGGDQINLNLCVINCNHPQENVFFYKISLKCNEVYKKYVVK